ncbi:MAG: hypothetical protein P1U89_09555 [Verrucomicrobiales bacterium]|nr:hypothetical protein [Verrucomicrobiales bacterium]
MKKAIHVTGIEPCPFLPEVDTPLRASAMKPFRGESGRDFYRQALLCAQSLWLQGLPAQSLLLINRAFGADHQADPEMCKIDPLPYAAAAWVMKNRKEDQFIGNPRRHYQHLATRMVEPRKTLRSWRAWACWAMACRIFPDYPADEEQMIEEGIVEPGISEIETSLCELGLKGEAELWRTVLKETI